MHQEHWLKALNYIFRNFLCEKKKKKKKKKDN